MKKTLIVASMLASLAAYGQGSVVFSNFVPGGTPPVNAPVFDVDGTTRLSGAGFQARLFAGPNAGALAGIGASTVFFTGAGAGYFNGGNRAIDSVAPGANATIEVRAWEGAAGSTFDTAVNKGTSPQITIATGGVGSPPSLPANLTGLQSFSMVPEPSILALGALGAVALLFRRRK